MYSSRLKNFSIEVIFRTKIVSNTEMARIGDIANIWNKPVNI